MGSSMADVVNKIDATWGRLDAVFANAGVSKGFGTIDTMTVEQFKSVMDVNVVGVFNAVRHSVSLMMKTSKEETSSGGSIVLCSSVFGARGGIANVDYVASKHAL